MLLIPKTCPVCSSTLERVKDQLFCRNEDCDARESKRILNFVKTMKIKGLGEKTLEKIDLEDISDLYRLTLVDLTTALGEKIGNKLFNEIVQSKTIPLATYIQSFGITLIGNSASTKLAKHSDTLWNIDGGICKKAGLGDKATNYLLQWINTNKDKYGGMPITHSTNPTKTETEELFKVCITGKLNDYTSRAKAKEFLETEGITVMSGVSSKVKYLVCDNRNNSSSETKAHKNNIPIISMNDLLTILNGEINV